MKLFDCPACSHPLFFENVRCDNCGRRLGYLPHANRLTSLDPAGDLWTAADTTVPRYRFCRNTQYECCNWLIPSDSDETYCLACRHNEIVPDLSIEQNIALWRKIEAAKHRLIYSLLRFGLPLETRREVSEGLLFDFLSDADPGAPQVMTGHDGGRITLALSEADDVEREARRSAMREPYRTLLGHFRHEIGHYFWDRLVRDGPSLEKCRALFGDDRADYGASLQAHYAYGAPAEWRQHFVSAYATAHPWEDFAETWAHYFHIVDTLEMIAAVGLETRPTVKSLSGAKIDFDSYRPPNARRLIEAWLPYTIALNSVNRCMGQSDLYPFVITETIVDKLSFVHELIAEARRLSPPGLPAEPASSAKEAATV
jgi:hypothetical protein